MTQRRRDGVLMGKQSALATPVTPDISVSSTEWDVQTIANSVSSGQVNPNSTESVSQILQLHAEGSLSCELGATNHDSLIYRCLGSVATTGPTDGTVYTHTHTFGTSLASIQDRLEKGSTIEAGSNGVFFTVVGACFDGFTVDVRAGQFVLTTYPFIAYSANTESGSGETHSPRSVLEMYTPLQVVLKAGILASEVTIPFLGANLSVSRGVEPRHGNLSSQNVTKMQENDMTEVLLTFSIDQDATERAAIKTAFENGTLSSCILQLTSDQVIPGSGSNQVTYQTTYNLKEGKYISRTAGVDGSTRTEEYVFKLGKSALADPFTVVNRNAQSAVV